MAALHHIWASIRSSLHPHMNLSLHVRLCDQFTPHVQEQFSEAYRGVACSLHPLAQNTVQEICTAACYMFRFTTKKLQAISTWGFRNEATAYRICQATRSTEPCWASGAGLVATALNFHMQNSLRCVWALPQIQRKGRTVRAFPVQHLMSALDISVSAS